MAEMSKIGEIELLKPLAVGTMAWGRTWLDEKLNRGNLSDETCAAIYKELTEVHQIQLFDTAEGYGGGTSEERLRDVANVANASGGDEKRNYPVVFASKFLPTIARWSRSSFHNALRRSCERLGSTCDIYFLHTPIHPLPLEFWISCACEAAKAGLIKEIGISNCNASQVRRAQAEALKHGRRIAANQVMFNLLCFNSPELQEMWKTCQELDVKIVAFGTVGQGMLTDNLTNEKFAKIRLAKMTGLKMDELRDLRGSIQQLAEKYGKSMAQICVNWAICHNAIPLVGIRSLDQARDAVGALGWKLEQEDLEELDRHALRRGTLSKPRWKRAAFVMFISTLVCCYQLNHCIDWCKSKWRSFCSFWRPHRD